MHSTTSSKMTLKKTLLLALGALGVVYGDIGTSPLYAVKEIFFGSHDVTLSSSNILGVISLVIWALTIIVTLKYVIFVLRADNDGEGGVFALFSLLKKKESLYVGIVSTLLILAAGLLFGDGVITPAISVVSAVEGLNVATSSFQPYIVPITLAILSGVFFVQKFGTSKIGGIFGPIVLLWFGAIAALGLSQVIKVPGILLAINPIYAFEFLIHHQLHSLFLVLGSVMLVVTGGEAMYADMGHFGRKPIRWSWFAITYPALLLNYLGQGAYLLSGQPILHENIFFSMVPSWGLYPMILLATLATIIASQALITGAFSLATQAMSLGLIPYLKTIHTHHEHEGQIYVPMVNWALFIGCLLLVLSFRTSSNLASAYGLAVSGVMLVTTLSMVTIAIENWKWKKWMSFALFLPLIAIDFMFLIANSLKLFQGGFVPLLVGLFVLLVMKTWAWGRSFVMKTYKQLPAMSIEHLIELKRKNKSIFPRSIIIMSPIAVKSKHDKIPFLKQIIWERYGALPKHIVFLTVISERVPHVHGQKYEVVKLLNSKTHGSVTGVSVRFGFMEERNVEAVLEELAKKHLLQIEEKSEKWLFQVAHERLFLDQSVKYLNKIRFNLFKLIQRNTDTADHFFGLGKKYNLTIQSIPVVVKN